jgi:hypothetical protein
MKLLLLPLLSVGLQATTYMWTVDAWNLGTQVERRYGQIAVPTRHSIWLEGSGATTVWLESLDGMHSSAPIQMREAIAQVHRAGTTTELPVLIAFFDITPAQSALLYSNLTTRLVADTVGEITDVRTFAVRHQFAADSWLGVSAASVTAYSPPLQQQSVSLFTIDTPEPSSLWLIAPALLWLSYRQRPHRA